MTTDDFNSLVAEVQGLTSKVNSLVDSVASLDLKYVRTKYLSQLTDVSITYPSEDDVLVYDTSGVWKNAQLSSIGSSSNGTSAQSIYIIGRDDDTDPTYTNVYSAARTLTDFVSSVNDDYVYGNLTFYNENTSTASKIYVDEITSRNYNQNTVLGSGFIYMINSAGNSYIEVDELAVRQSMVVNSMEIKEINSVGGALIISPASETITRVEETTQIYNSSYQTVWRCYFTSTNVSTEQTISTNFVAGDLARIQTYNVTNTGVYENSSNSYYWGLVLGVGDGYIDLSQTDVDSASTITTPSAGDTVVQFGNISNTARQNVIMLDTYGTGNPSISMYQGISSYDLTDKVMIQMAYDETEEQAYFTVYGRTYFGTKDETTSYVKYNPQTNLVTIKADIRIVGEEDGNDTLISGGYINTKYIDADTIVSNVSVIHSSLQVGDDGEGGYNFVVDSEGNMTAKSATIYGSLLDQNGNYAFNADGSGFIDSVLSWDASGSMTFSLTGAWDQFFITNSGLFIQQYDVDKLGSVTMGDDLKLDHDTYLLPDNCQIYWYGPYPIRWEHTGSITNVFKPFSGTFQSSSGVTVWVRGGICYEESYEMS